MFKGWGDRRGHGCIGFDLSNKMGCGTYFGWSSHKNMHERGEVQKRLKNM